MYNSTKINVIKLLFSMTRFAFLLTIVTMTLTGVLMGADVKSQNLKEAKITLTTKNTILAEVLNKIEQQTEFTFSFAKKVGEIELRSFQANNRSLAEILKELASSRRLQFTQLGDLIAINELPVPPKPGKVYGRIVDDNGGSLPGAYIRIIELNITTASAVDGSYSITVPPGNYTVEVSYVSFQRKRIADVTIKTEALTKLDVVLSAASNALNTIVITSSFKKESAASLYAAQKNAASVTDGISAEQIARTPDNNMGQVMKRVSGVTTLNNRYVIVRGLTERYNQGMIDGIVLPSTDMNRHNFSFDVIPVEMVSNVVVNKTATPDVSAEFAGGQVSVNTLDIPLENFTVVSLGSGFNSQTLGKDFVQAGKRGKYDFLGFDDGHRKLPDNIRSWGNGPIPDYAVAQSKLFSPDVFKIYKSPGGLNQNYRFSAGRVYNLKNDRKWGFVAGLSLRNNQDTYNYINARGFFPFTTYPREVAPRNIDSIQIRREGNIYKYNTTAGAQFNAGIQGKTYKIGFKNIFSQIFNNSFNTSTGAFPDNGGGGPVIRSRTGLQDPEITGILQNKLEGENTLTDRGLKLTWLVARTMVDQQTRDRTRFTHLLTVKEDGVEYYQTPNIANPNITNPVYDYRIFTNTREVDYNYALNLSQSFNFLGDKSLVKAGYNGIKKHRSLSATTLNIRTEDRSFDSFNRPYEELMDPGNMGIGAGQAYYLADANNGTQFNGKSTFNAGYLMLDQKFFKKIRIIYGIRAEKYNLENKQPFVLEDNVLARKVTGEKNTSYLPSANLIYSITPKINLRASFAKTIIRPDFRETSYFGFYDVDLDALILGGNLTSTKIKNTDLRFEWYPSPGEIFSISGFYKSFDKPIELVADQDASGKVTQYRYQNQKDATNYGLEIELRKSLGFIDDKQWLNNISLFGNGSIIKSKINTLSYEGTDRAKIVETNESRALYGQSPYVINAGVAYTSPGYGMTISYNRSGRRTNIIAVNPIYSEYENGRSQVDLQLFCRLLKGKMELKLNVANLLNSESLFYLNSNGYGEDSKGKTVPLFGTDKYEKNFDDIRYRVKYGVTSSLAVSYKL